MGFNFHRAAPAPREVFAKTNDRARRPALLAATDTASWVAAELLLRNPQLDSEFRPKLKGSIVEGSNHSNFSDQSSVKILSE